MNEPKEQISWLMETGKAPPKSGDIRRQLFWIAIKKLTSL